MDRLKSILFVLPSTEVGGAETRFFKVMKLMRGVRSVLLTHEAVARYFSILDIGIYNFEAYRCHRPMHVTLQQTINYARAIRQVARKEKITCIVGIMHTGCFYASFAKDLFRLKVPVIGTIEGPISDFFRTEKRTPTFFEKTLLWYLLKRPQVIVVPGKGVKNDLEKNWGVIGRKILVIYNSIEADDIRTLAEGGMNFADEYDGKIIVTACRLNAQKDFTTLLKAFKAVRERIKSRLVIVGDGELRETIVNLARDLGIHEHLVITGFQRNPFPYMKAASIFVLSTFFEGLPTVILEALALGLPVIATDCPGVREIVQHGVNGLLVPSQDHNSMAKAILKLLEDTEIRNKLRMQGMENAAIFRAEIMAEDFKQLILKLCEGAL